MNNINENTAVLVLICQMRILVIGIFILTGLLDGGRSYTFTDIDQHTFTYKPANGLTVFVFLSPTCPLCQDYSLTLNRISKRFATLGVKMFGVFQDSIFEPYEMKQYRNGWHISFPLIIDRSASLRKELQATITPEAVLVDGQGQILYRGRVDNWAYRLAARRQVVTEHDLTNAIESAIHGKPIKVKRTKAIGCYIE